MSSSELPSGLDSAPRSSRPRAGSIIRALGPGSKCVVRSRALKQAVGAPPGAVWSVVDSRSSGAKELIPGEADAENFQRLGQRRRETRAKTDIHVRLEFLENGGPHTGKRERSDETARQGGGPRRNSITHEDSGLVGQPILAAGRLSGGLFEISHLQWDKVWATGFSRLQPVKGRLSGDLLISSSFT